MTATIELDDAEHVEEPPAVSDTLPAELRCESPATEIDLSTYISASDPDGDVDVSGWLVGDAMYATDGGFGNGTYDIAAVAIDTRGAVDVGPVKTLQISGCP